MNLGFGVWGLGFGEKPKLGSYGKLPFHSLRFIDGIGNHRSYANSPKKIPILSRIISQTLNSPQTPNPIPQTLASNFAFRKGFGLLEVMAAAVVLGFLLVGLNILQKGNREAVLRIRTRDAAQIVAQNFMDNLSSLGISSVPIGETTDTKDYEWKGNDGKINSKVTYTIKANVANVVELQSTESSQFENSVHTPAKKVTLTVSWPYKSATMSISEERILK
jgi:prepilin-type N-terminal cleavage/methylation domain-containing protein